MKKYGFFIVFLFFSFILIINCEKDCSECEVSDSSSAELKCSNCDKDCMWFQIDSTNSKCLSCDDINISESKYYSKGTRLNGEPYCHKIGITGFKNKKIIYKTNQIVEKCKDLNLYQMGDVCYHSNPDPTNIIENESEKILQCNFYNYKEIKDGLIYYKCLEENEICPDELNYFDDFTKECFNSCPKTKNKIAIIKAIVNNENKVFYKCTSECSGEYDKEFTKQSALGKYITYCLENCPEEAKYFYESNKKCIENCDTSLNHFFTENNKCTDNTNDCGESFYFLINPKINYYSCKSGFSNCPEDYPYKYTDENQNNYCLTSCEDTNIPFLGRIKTYLYLYNGQKICTNIRPSNDQSSLTNYYIDEKGKKWVIDCLSADSGPFHEGEKCVDNCGDKFIVEDTNECVVSCDTTDNKYYIDINNEIKTCVKKCHSYLGRGYSNSNNECVKCGINGEGSGFHEKDGIKCYSECQTTEFKYHNYNNNICFETECKDNLDYKYSSPDNPYICYNSCSDIGEEYIYEINFVCYKNKPTSTQVSDISNYYFYKNVNGIYKYIKIKEEDAIKEEELLKFLNICFSLGLRYLRNSECIQDCESTEYKVYPKSNKFGQCFSDSSKCKEAGYNYYNSSKICSDECDNALSVKKKESSDSEYSLVLETDNCLEECPNEYPFQYGNACLKECPDNFYYIESGSNKICQSNCDDYIINEANGKKKCSKHCISSNIGIPIFDYYIKNSDLKICVDSCNKEELSYKFSVKATNEPKECLDSCPNDYPYYDENDKICLKRCDNYYDGNKCVDSCNSFVYMENQCLNSCPEEAPFYNVNDSGIKECVASCTENLKEYFLLVDANKYECKNSLEENPSYSIFNGEIVESCPSGLERDTENFKCKRLSDWDYFIISDNTAISATETDCYSKYITTSFECVEICPLGEHFISTDGVHCQSSCNGSYYKKKI